MMGEVGLELFSSRRISRRTDFKHTYSTYETVERFFNWQAPIEDVAAACRDPEAIAKAAALSATMSDAEGKKKRPRYGIYVISADEHGVSKIGISSNPIVRFDSLQQSNWSELSLYAVVWPLVDPALVERVAHETCKGLGLYLRHEWVDMEAQQAFDIVFRSAKQVDVPLADSATWLANWTTRVETLMKTRRQVKYKPPRKQAA